MNAKRISQSRQFGHLLVLRILNGLQCQIEIRKIPRIAMLMMLCSYSYLSLCFVDGREQQVCIGARFIFFFSPLTLDITAFALVAVVFVVVVVVLGLKTVYTIQITDEKKLQRHH